MPHAIDTEAVPAAEVAALREELRKFMEIHTGTRLVESNAGALKMLVLHAKNTLNKKPKDKLINWKLSEVRKRLLEDENAKMKRRDFVICEFLVEELKKYVASQLR